MSSYEAPFVKIPPEEAYEEAGANLVRGTWYRVPIGCGFRKLSGGDGALLVFTRSRARSYYGENLLPALSGGMEKIYMNDIMIDLETLDITTTAVIVSLGAVKMDLDKCELKEEFYAPVDLDQARYGRTMGADTVRWWLQQNSAAQDVFRLPATELSSLSVVLLNFSRFVNEGSGVKAPALWGNGANFDNVILKSAYEGCGIAYPAQYWNDRCYRTMRAILAPNSTAGRTGGVKHNALDDARAQATILVAIMKKLKG